MAALFATVLALSVAPAADAVAPLKDRFNGDDEAFFTIFAHDHKVGELRQTQKGGTFVSDWLLLLPNGPNRVGVGKRHEQHVYSPKDGLLEGVSCGLDNPNTRVEGRRDGNEIVLNIKVQNAVTQYRIPALSIDTEQIPQRLAATGALGSKIDFTSFDCFSGKTQEVHAVLQSKAQRRVDGAVVPVYKIVMTGAKATDSSTLWCDGQGHLVEVRIKGGMVVLQRQPKPEASGPKNPFVVDDQKP